MGSARGNRAFARAHVARTPRAQLFWRAPASAALCVVMLALQACHGCGAFGVAALVPRLGVEPEAIDLGDVYVGATAERAVTLRGTGTARVRLNGLRVDGDDTELRLDSDEALSTGVAAGAAIDVGLVWSPRMSGPLDAILIVQSDAVNASEVRVPIHGSALAALDCDDHNACTDETFDAPHGLCVRSDVTRACNDGNACTADDACSAGACRGVAITCADAVACTRDVCDADSGCAFIPDDSACDDGNPCTADTCDGVLGCLNAEQPDGTPCAPLDSCATAQICVAATCTVIDVPEGFPCFDGESCTVGDRCTSGQCMGTWTEGAGRVQKRVSAFGAPGADAIFLDGDRVLFLDDDGGGVLSFAVVSASAAALPARFTRIRLASSTFFGPHFLARDGARVYLHADDGALRALDVDAAGNVLEGPVAFFGGWSSGASAVTADGHLLVCDDTQLDIFDFQLALDGPVNRLDGQGAACVAPVPLDNDTLAVVYSDRVDLLSTAAGVPGEIQRSTDVNAAQACAVGDTLVVMEDAETAGPPSLRLLDTSTLNDAGSLVFPADHSGGPLACTGGSAVVSALTADGTCALLVYAPVVDGSEAARYPFPCSARPQLSLRGAQALLIPQVASDAIRVLDGVDGSGPPRRTSWPALGTLRHLVQNDDVIFAVGRTSLATLLVPEGGSPVLGSLAQFDVPADAVALSSALFSTLAIPAGRSWGTGAFVSPTVPAVLHVVDASGAEPTAEAVPIRLAPLLTPVVLGGGSGLLVGVSDPPAQPLQLATYQVPLQVPASEDTLTPLGTVNLRVGGFGFSPGNMALATDTANGRAAVALREEVDLVDLSDPSSPTLVDVDLSSDQTILSVALDAAHLVEVTAPTSLIAGSYAGDRVRVLDVTVGLSSLRELMVEGAGHVLLISGETALVATADGILFVDVSADPLRALGLAVPIDCFPLSALALGDSFLVGCAVSATLITPPCAPAP